MSRLALLVVAGFALAACEGPTAPTQVAQRTGSSPSFDQANTTKVNQIVPINTWLQNPCNNEWVYFSGNEHVDETVTVGATSSTYDLHLNLADVSGVGQTTGALYHFNAAAKEVQFASSSTFSIDELVNEEVIASGNVPNFTAEITETFGWDGTNYYTTIKRYTTACRG